MVTNRYNRRRANKGTPPICKSKDPPPPPPPPSTCVCTLTSAYEPLSKGITTSLVVYTSLVPKGTQLAYNIECTPPLAGAPLMALYNGGPAVGRIFAGTTDGVTYTITAEIFVGYHMICNRWTNQTAS